MNKVIKIKDVALGHGTQQRVIIKPEDVSEYAEAMINGTKFPPIKCVYDSVNYYVVDGNHRFLAAKKIGCTEIEAEVIDGTVRDAIWLSLGANATHGLKRTNEDKAKSVLTALNDKEWCNLPDAEIAKQCGVDRKTVYNLRAKLKVNSRIGEIPQTLPANPHVAVKKDAKNEDFSLKSATKNDEKISKKFLEDIAEDEISINLMLKADLGKAQADEEAAMRAEMLNDALDALRDENESLRNQLSASLFTGTGEERAEYLDRLNFLTAENKRLTMLNNGLTVSRDRFMRENVQLRKQGEYAAKRLKALEKAA